MVRRLDRLAASIGYSFRNGDLLRQALTHRSAGSPHNERLEFLGDSILNCIIAHDLYQRFPQLPEGDLSRLRASLVRQQTLADLAQAIQLGDYLSLGEGEMRSGGFRRPSILADAIEALFGAVYLDGGFEAAQQVVRGVFSAKMDAVDPVALSKDPKTLLQEYLQGRKLQLPQYCVVAVRGEAHEQQFEVECSIPELAIRTLGAGSSRRIAEQEAANSAYQQASQP